MANRVQLIRHAAGPAAIFEGREGEITIDLGNNSIRVHDGINPGGTESARRDLNTTPTASASTHGKMSAQQSVDLVTVIAGLAQEIIDRTADVDTVEAAKANLAVPLSAGNIAILTALGHLQDSGKSFASTDDVVDNFPAGTAMLFQQTAAPVGWTKSTTHNDKALRIVSGTVGSGGSSAFSTVFGKTATNSHTLTISEMPSHDHPIIYANPLSGGSSGGLLYSSSDIYNTASTATSTQGGGGGHAHNMDIRVQYVDFIIAVKN